MWCSHHQLLGWKRHCINAICPSEPRALCQNWNGIWYFILILRWYNKLLVLHSAAHAFFPFSSICYSVLVFHLTAMHHSVWGGHMSSPRSCPRWPDRKYLIIPYHTIPYQTMPANQADANLTSIHEFFLSIINRIIIITITVQIQLSKRKKFAKGEKSVPYRRKSHSRSTHNKVISVGLPHITISFFAPSKTFLMTLDFLGQLGWFCCCYANWQKHICTESNQ